MIQHFSEANNLEIFRSYTINFPIIRNWNSSLEQVPALVFENQKALIPWIRQLSEKTEVLTSASTIAQIKSKLISANSSAVVFVLPTQVTSKVIEKLQLFVDAITFGEFDGERVVAAGFLACVGLIPEDIRNLSDFLSIYIDEEVQEAPDILTLIPSAEDLSLVQNRIEMIRKNYHFPKGIAAAIAFTYPKLHEMGGDDRFQSLIESGLKLFKESFEKDYGTVELALDCFFRRIFLTSDVAVQHLPNIDENALSDAVLCLKNDFLYCSKQWFDETFSQAIELVGSDEVRRELANAGIIKCDKNSGFTTKMNYFTKNGTLKRIRRIKIDLRCVPDFEGKKMKEFLEVL